MRTLCVTNVGRTLLTATAIALLLGVAAAQNPAGKFSALGQARLVIGGVPPDTKAVDLTSQCTSAPIPCGFSPTYSGVAFVPKAGHTLLLNQITNLSTDYNFGGADCGGGAPRFEIVLNGVTPHLWGYFGPPPDFVGCFYGWLNTGNLTTDTTPRWYVGNTSYTWTTLVAAYGSDAVTEIAIIVDSGWFAARGQDLTIDNFTINNRVLQANECF